MASGQAWTLVKNYEGVPKPSDFKLVDEKVNTTLKDGEILVKALFLSVDPYMRVAQPAPGSVLTGEQVARVEASKNKDYPKGCLVQFHHGWRTLAVISPDMKSDGVLGGLMLQKLPDLGDLSPSTALGVLGMTGLTAYFALEDKAKPQPGQVVVVSGAAGAVGGVAGQIAKLRGATVIGSASSEEKLALLKKWGFDHVFNYKTMSVDDAMKKFAPNGVDLYFDNVGGDFSWSVLQNMKDGGRAIIVGSMSTYNDSTAGRHNLYEVLTFKGLTFYGLLVWHYFKRFPQAVSQLQQWVKKGDLKYVESVVDGFDKMPHAFISLFSGKNTGKVVVKV